MKILHINFSAPLSGSAKAAYRLNNSFNKNNLDSAILLSFKLFNDSSLLKYNPSIKNKIFYKFNRYYNRSLISHYKKNIQFSNLNFGYNLNRLKEVKNADIIILHMLHRNHFSFKGLKELALSGKPVIWLLHDMWCMTGGCHYSGKCDNYINCCGNCPLLDSGEEYDLSYKNWKIKKELISSFKNLNIICPSRWLYKKAADSSLLKDQQLMHLPLTIDTDLFKPLDKKKFLSQKNIDPDKKIILFGALDPAADIRKGYHLLIKAFELLAKKINYDQVQLIIFGNMQKKDIGVLPFKTTCLGTINDDKELAKIYSAADLFTAPSLEDNLPLTVMESLSCGTPVVAFKIGGMPDMIEQKRNGFLAEKGSADSLAEGIKWILSAGNEKLSIAARKSVMEKYAEELIYREYNKLFKNLLNK